jgi:predicted metal-dependent hydrolase
VALGVEMVFGMMISATDVATGLQTNQKWQKQKLQRFPLTERNHENEDRVFMQRLGLRNRNRANITRNCMSDKVKTLAKVYKKTNKNARLLKMYLEKIEKDVKSSVGKG